MPDGLDLEAFLLEAETTEEREVRCRPQTLEVLNQIASRTGCEPRDIAAQGVTCVAFAIQEAGFEFSLPMRDEVKARRASFPVYPGLISGASFQSCSKL